MGELRSSLLGGRVDEHKMWQDADNKIWLAEDAFDHSSPAPTSRRPVGGESSIRRCLAFSFSNAGPVGCV